MTRDERIQAALTVNSATYPAETSIRDAAAAALDAALADLGGLDGLAALVDRAGDRESLIDEGLKDASEIDRLRADGRTVRQQLALVQEDRHLLRVDRDRLRDALNGVLNGDDDAWSAAHDALADSEAGT